MLLDAGADRNARDVDGNTPAHIAAEGEDADQLRMLASETWQDCVKCTFLQAYGIICAIPSSWKSKIRVFGKRLLVVKSENIERLFKTKKGDQFYLWYFAKIGCNTAN